MDRRNFFSKLSITGLGLAFTHSCASISAHSASNHSNDENYKTLFKNHILLAPHRYSRILIHDLKTDKKTEIESVPNLHQVLYDPYRDLIFAIPRISSFIPVYSLKSQKEVARINALSNSYFYGHGDISDDKKFISFTEVSSPDSKGTVSVWNLDTLSLSKRISTLGFSPHDCHYDKDRTEILYVVNGGNVPKSWDINNKSHFSFRMEHPGSLVSVNTHNDTASILSQFDMRYGSPGHIHFGGRSCVVIFAPDNPMNSGNILISNNQFSFKEVDLGKNKVLPRGQALSLAHDPKENIFIVTHPEGELVTIWNAKNGSHIKTLPIHTNGVIVPTPGFALFNSTINSSAILLNTSNWNIEVLDDIQLGNGPHITMTSPIVI